MAPRKVSALLRQLPWTHHLLILGHAKLPEERNFYLQAAITAKWISRELERQLRTQAFRRRDPGATKVSAALAQLHPAAIEEFKNAYSLEFLELRDGHFEAKDDEVVEYALARTTSPTLVAEYQTMLPTKALLRRKLHELYAHLAPEGSISTVIAGAAPGGADDEAGQTNRGRQRSTRREGDRR